MPALSAQHVTEATDASEVPIVPAATVITIIPLGVAGGLTEDNLSAYLVTAGNPEPFIALDAGTLRIGVQRALERKAFEGLLGDQMVGIMTPDRLIRDHIAAYLISHPHVDHIAGLVLNAPEDGPKPILGTTATLKQLRDHVFNWQIWPNFGNDGAGYRIGQYAYRHLTTGVRRTIPGTAWRVEAWPLSHAEQDASTAFLLTHGAFSLLYCGDTGSDTVEHSTNLERLWQRVAPLIRSGRLRILFMEASYPDGRPDNRLYGHMTPTWLAHEMGRLAQHVRPDHPQTALQNLTLLVTHIKPPSQGESDDPRGTILRQLEQRNQWGLRIRLPQQGERMDFQTGS
jgi:3',5'-cyclic-nucleotide phosphodiesterase